MYKTKNYRNFYLILLILFLLISSSCKGTNSEITSIVIKPTPRKVELKINNFSIEGKKINLLDTNDDIIYFISYKGTTDRILENNISISKFDFVSSKSTELSKIDGFLNKSFSEKMVTYWKNYLFITEKDASKIYLKRFNILTGEEKTLLERPVNSEQREEFSQPFSSSYNYIFERIILDSSSKKTMLYYIPEDRIFYKDMQYLLGLTPYETENYLYYYIPQDTNTKIQIFKKPDIADDSQQTITIDENQLLFGSNYEKDHLIFYDLSTCSLNYYDLNKLRVIKTCEIKDIALQELLLPEQKSYIFGLPNKEFDDFIVIPSINQKDTNVDFYRITYNEDKNNFYQRKTSIDLSSYGSFDLLGWFLSKTEESGIKFLLKNKMDENIYLCTHNFDNNNTKLYPLYVKLEANYAIIDCSTTQNYIWFAKRLFDFNNPSASAEAQDSIFYFKSPES